MKEPSVRAPMIATPKLSEVLHEFAMSEGDWPAKDWWRVFKSPQLNRLMTEALIANPGLKEVAARVRQAQSLVDVQAAELYPTVQANVSFAARRFSANSTQAKLAGEHFRQALINPLVLRYHLDIWGRDRAALQAAVGEAAANKTELIAARLLLSATVAKVYFNLLQAEQNHQDAERIVNNSQQIVHLNEIRLRQGLISDSPLLAADRAWRQAKQQQAEFKAEAAVHRHRLAVLAGKGPDWGRAIVADGIVPEAPSIPDDLPLGLLSHRPDVAASRLRVEAAAEAIKVAETAFYPDVNLLSFAGLHSVSLSDVLLQGSSLAYAVGPTIEFPLFEGGRLRAELNYREAAYDEAVERYNGQLLKAVNEVADALARYQEGDMRLSEQHKVLEAAVKSQRLAEVLYRQGLNDKIQMLQARTDAYLERLRLTFFENSYLFAVTDVLTALGGGFVATPSD